MIMMKMMMIKTIFLVLTLTCDYCTNNERRNPHKIIFVHPLFHSQLFYLLCVELFHFLTMM